MKKQNYEIYVMLEGGHVQYYLVEAESYVALYKGYIKKIKKRVMFAYIDKDDGYTKVAPIIGFKQVYTSDGW